MRFLLYCLVKAAFFKKLVNSLMNIFNVSKLSEGGSFPCYVKLFMIAILSSF